jgi:hypothetical protein
MHCKLIGSVGRREELMAIHRRMRRLKAITGLHAYILGEGHDVGLGPRHFPAPHPPLAEGCRHIRLLLVKGYSSKAGGGCNWDQP